MKKTLALIGLVLFFSACNALKDGAPADLIPTDKMALILYEVHKTETMTSRMSFNTFDSAKVAFDYLQLKIFEDFEIDSSQYRKSYEYYASNPDQFAMIYEQVEGMLEKEVDEE